MRGTRSVSTIVVDGGCVMTTVMCKANHVESVGLRDDERANKRMQRVEGTKDVGDVGTITMTMETRALFVASPPSPPICE